MSQKRVKTTDIVVGQRLPWDVMDSTGYLLLRKGYIIETLSQVEALVKRGIFIEVSAAGATGNPASAATPQPPPEPPSSLRSINLAIKRMDMILHALPNLPDARAKIMEVIKTLTFAVHLNPDLALASILLNQSAGIYSVRHGVDTAILAMLVAQAMQKSEGEITQIVAAALTMNVSKLSLHEKLQHKTEPLTQEEKDIIHSHPHKGIEILHEAGIEDSDWMSYILLHHEHEDGTGYPVGKMKHEIPHNAKILTLADGFCARITSRGYRKHFLPNVALRDIFIENGAKVDAMLGAYFINVLGLYPPGTFVKLKNKEIAIVSHRGTGPTSVYAHSLVNGNGEVRAAPIKRDTGSDPYTIVEGMLPSQASVHVSMQMIWGTSAKL